MSAAPMPIPPTEDPRDLIACPQCDLLHHLPEVVYGATARCRRCRTVILRPRVGAVRTIVSLASAALVLMVAAVTFPFLSIETQGLASDASVLDAVLSGVVVSGRMAPLSVALAALIVLLPVARLSGIVYALGPLLTGHPPRRHAAAVFRMAMRLRPWAMAEIFIIGVAVALIKVAALASVSLGPAFWAFVGLVLLITAQDTMLCERSIWRVLKRG